MVPIPEEKETQADMQRFQVTRMLEEKENEWKVTLTLKTEERTRCFKLSVGQARESRENKGSRLVE